MPAAEYPISAEIAARLAMLFPSGRRPTHDNIESDFISAGCHNSDPGAIYSKQRRVLAVLSSAVLRPERSRDLVDGLLGVLRLDRVFDQLLPGYDEHLIHQTQEAFARQGWDLSDAGELGPSLDTAV